MSNQLKFSVVLLFALTIGTTITAKTSEGIKMIGMLDFEDLDTNFHFREVLELHPNNAISTS